MYQIKVFFDFKERKIIYNTCMLSNINYYPIICLWENIQKKIEAVQERVLRLMFNDKNPDLPSDIK